MASLARSYLEALLLRKRHRAIDLVMEALEEGTTIEDLYLHVFQMTQYEVGWLWENGVISVGHEHYCTNSTQMTMAMLYPRIFEGAHGPRRIVSACVQGELHELGVRMLADFFTIHGWDSDFLGANTPIDGVLRMLEEAPTDLLAISVTMHTNLENAERLIAAVRASHGTKIPIFVGGYSIRTVGSLWRKLGADGTSHDARQAIDLAERILSVREGQAS